MLVNCLKKCQLLWSADRQQAKASTRVLYNSLLRHSVFMTTKPDMFKKINSEWRRGGDGVFLLMYSSLKCIDRSDFFKLS